MPRITISIPADLRDRLNNPAVKKSINVSRVCQEALARVVRRLLELPVDLGRMERLLARLLKEREEARDRWFAVGTAAARDWVEHEASDVDLRRLGEATLAERMRMLDQAPPPALSHQLEANRGEEDFMEPSFLEGWAHMIGLLWEVIRRNL